MSSQKKKQIKNRIKYMLQKNIEFIPGRIQRNQITLPKQVQPDDEYIFQQTLSHPYLNSPLANIQNQNKEQSKGEKSKRSDKSTISKQKEQKAKSLMSQLTYPIHIKNKIKIEKQQNVENKQNATTEHIGENVEDLTQLWNTIQGTNTQQNRNLQENQPIVLQKVNNTSQNKTNQQFDIQLSKEQKSVSQDKLQSQCQLTEQQMNIWLATCQQQNKDQRRSNRSNCIYYPYEAQKNSNEEKNQKNQKNQDQDDEQQWNVIAGYLQEQDNKYEDLSNGKYQYEGFVRQNNFKQSNNQDNQCFLIMDTPSKQFKIRKNELINQMIQQNDQQKQMVNKNYHNNSKFGPWVYNYTHYQIYPEYNIKLIQQVNLNIEKYKKLPIGEQGKILYKQSTSIRKINWQIQEEKKPQIRALRSKRNCKMNLMQFGQDFFIFDHAKFATSPIREGTHLYMGVRAFGDFSQSQFRQKSSKSLVDAERKNAKIKQYMYFPENGQCLLETEYPNQEQNLNQNSIKLIDMFLSLTMQKIAVCERIILEEQKDKIQRLQIKLYDNFSSSVQHYLGIIQSKISNFSQQWYCDTVIYIPRKKIYVGKILDKNWQKFKIQLRLSQMGTIVAELGIFDAKSSVTNCILFGEDKSSQFMMGTIEQNSKQINYITRIGGLSPVMAFATILSRKIFVMSS